MPTAPMRSSSTRARRPSPAASSRPVSRAGATSWNAEPRHRYATDRGGGLYRQRQRVVEPVFAHTKFKHPAHERVETAVPAWSVALAWTRVGRNQDLCAAGDDPLHLLVMPIAGVRKRRLGAGGDAGVGEFGLHGGEHRLEVPEVRSGDDHLGGEHDLVLVGRGLGVVALHPAEQPFTSRESGSVTLIFPAGPAAGDRRGVFNDYACAPRRTPPPWTPTRSRRRCGTRPRWRSASSPV